jgi:hypothetical protein
MASIILLVGFQLVFLCWLIIAAALRRLARRQSQLADRASSPLRASLAIHLASETLRTASNHSHYSDAEIHEKWRVRSGRHEGRLEIIMMMSVAEAVGRVFHLLQSISRRSYP